MKSFNSSRSFAPLETLEGRRMFSSSVVHDSLYISDGGDDTVKRFDAATGEFQGNFVESASGGLHGPRGIIFRNPGKLLVVNQNVDQPFAGEVLRYNGQTGAAQGAAVPSSDPNAPFAPRAIVMKDNVLYVSTFENATTPTGEIDRFDVNSGQFLGRLAPSTYFGQFNPRGIVFGPDGGLYVSVGDTTNPLAGALMRFDVNTGDSTIIAKNNGDAVADPGETANLHRPDGLTFGPDGQLYTTSFRADASDSDRILVFNASTGAVTGSINQDLPGGDRAFSQAIEFGPGGKLYAPVTGTGPDTGSVRAYDVSDGTFQTVVPAGSVGQGWYLTFGRTDPATLAYEGGEGAHNARSNVALPTTSASMTVHQAEHVETVADQVLEN